MTKSRYEEHYRFRDELVYRLALDLVGPMDGSDEVLTDPPVTTYPVGVLFPRSAHDDQEEEPSERESEQNPDQAPDVARREQRGGDLDDAGVALANLRRPSAVGITFAVDPEAAPVVTLHVDVARYVPVDAEGKPTVARHAEQRSTQDEGVRWRRERIPVEAVPVDVTVPGTLKPEIVPGLRLRTVVRDKDASGAVAVTATLVNTTQAPDDRPQDEFCFFQPRMTVVAPYGSGGLVERRVRAHSSDVEVEVSRLLYRHAPSFATGHGCAADWHWVAPPPNGVPADAGPCRVDQVRTEFVPTYEVMLTDSNPAIDTASLGMKWLATAERDEIAPALRALLSSYEAWVDERAVDAEALGGSEFAQLARDQIDNCRTALKRMRSGVERLVDDRGTNEGCFEAFQLANRAMDDQRTQGETIKHGGLEEPNRWRPFQIGFVLLCLDGIADPNHEDRQIADLLWFPTGGGKTEAYLSLIAFTTFLRRLRRGESGGGVTVFMRYTLRLLTLQQFERATALICAMERIRREHGRRLGTERISIGMWVGQSATPNDLKTAEKSLQKLRNDQSVAKENPVQLRACPWCGFALGPNDYTVTLAPAAMVVACPDESCDFHDGLPVHVVDETVYHARPTLVIATVDKFALIPWKPEAAALFNRNRPADDTPPPELVVQDELHLISGPLGTMTGLDETMVDLAAETPKVIASTATIRKAKDQGKALFHREVHQFPPTGLDSRDSWFSVEAPAHNKATRRYLGLLTPSTSQATLLVRAYSALLHHAAQVEGDDEVRDAYWTLVGYFNSLRLLAAAELQVRDDVQDRLKLLAERSGSKPRELNEPTELTSRIDASDIPKYLKDLERRLPNPEAVGVLLATNMISVGVDIDRLGLMTVMGQPQTTAEYIQATSRVGRRHPGLVVTLLNSARSRDRSHYENFVTYHSALYRQVESTSVTPFSPRARDRALHAVLVGLARLMVETARPTSAAAKVASFTDRLQDIRTAITGRARCVAEEHADDVDAELDAIIGDWHGLAEAHPDDLVYEGWFGKRPALLVPYAEAGDADAFPTLTSMRDVDAESDLFEEK
ncbi:helicase-related protein [Streptomyces sp. NPDC047082]|uniref:helicase-related protein n=1 Tax=Streptomyces sp. NPDC047082 TaxID=3155259 RepID=UPI0033C4315F